MIIIKEGEVDIGGNVRASLRDQSIDSADAHSCITAFSRVSRHQLFSTFYGADILVRVHREAAEALESGAEQVNNIVHSFRLTSTTFDKKSYLTYLKVRSASASLSFAASAAMLRDFLANRVT